jgi:hypothetical protein
MCLGSPRHQEGGSRSAMNGIDLHELLYLGVVEVSVGFVLYLVMRGE